MLHKWKNIAVICGGRQHQLAVTEGVLNRLRRIAQRKVIHCNLWAAESLQLLCQPLCSLFGVAVNRGIGNANALAFHPVGRPCVIKPYIIA